MNLKTDLYGRYEVLTVKDRVTKKKTILTIFLKLFIKQYLAITNVNTPCNVKDNLY